MSVSRPISNELDPIAGLLKALGHPTRVKIIRQLADRDRCCTGDFCDCLNLAQSTISQHVEMLIEAGLVERKSSGTKSIFTLNRNALSDLASAMSELAGVSEDGISTNRGKQRKAHRNGE